MFLSRFLLFFLLQGGIFLQGLAQECVNEGGNDEVCESPPAAESATAELDPNCPDRDHLMRCASKYLDTNGNGKLDRDELQGAINKLPWYVHSSPLDKLVPVTAHGMASHFPGMPVESLRSWVALTKL